jgi:glycosyltransferase involved in cell wall biosynthesis
MKVSIITATYNSEATIEDTLRSVVGQRNADIEYIVIDGGSADRTLQIIEKYRSHITHLRSEPDRGIYDALNKGIQLASGEVTGILHSDDVFADPDVVAGYAELIGGAGCDAAYGDLYYVSRENTEKVIRRWKSGSYRHGMFYNGWMPPHPTFFVRTALYRKHGAFNPALKIAGDYELMLRLIHKHRISLCYMQKVTVKMRVGGASNRTLADRFLANREDREAWRINGITPRFYTIFVKPLRKILQFVV